MKSSLQNIRNFSIIAHIDHGKSTLADRLLEVTGTIESRKMREQVLDSMELERERGITIKMQPVRMDYLFEGEKYVLNLIDTPGHIDFSYEVSRALKAVEGSILLVDATQGIQAQTLTTLQMAEELGLKIIPVLSKVDSSLARTDEVKLEVADLLKCDPDEVIEVSGKTGQGTRELLQEVIKRIPAPQEEDRALRQNSKNNIFRGLVFDFEYSNHRGIIVYIRVFEGAVAKNESLFFSATNQKFSAGEVGIFSPIGVPKDSLDAGEIGYIVTGIKKPGVARVGDTITLVKNPLPALAGYHAPLPVVWASIYPESQDDFSLLHQALERLKLSDSSFSFEEESSGSLGRGFRCGFLGMLHLEIVLERLRREFGVDIVVTTPSINYRIKLKGGKTETIYSPSLFPDDGLVESVEEPWVDVHIISPTRYLGAISQILFDHEAVFVSSENFGDDRADMKVEMPLRELMRHFFEEIKSATSGYASISYKLSDLRRAEVVRLDILVAEEPVPAFAKIVSKKRVQEEAESIVEKLKEILPRQLFTVKIQGKAMGRILSSAKLSALKKDVTGHLYGGDITRKMKLREKQKKGKKKMRERGKVNIPQETFLKMMKK